MPSKKANTRLLLDVTGGDENAAAKLLPLIYDTLHALAERYMQKERANHTLQPTALVNEACVQLLDRSKLDWKSNTHFFALSARVMRNVLVDHWRKHRTKITLDEAVDDSDSDRQVDLLALDEALDELAEKDERQARVVEMKYFGGLTEEEIAFALDVSRRTVQREWHAAKAWLGYRLHE